MCSDVRFQAERIGEALLAQVAGVRFLPVVFFFAVFLHGRIVEETFPAGRTDVRFLTGVFSHVRFQSERPSEPFPADVARVWFFVLMRLAMVV